MRAFLLFGGGRPIQRQASNSALRHTLPMRRKKGYGDYLLRTHLGVEPSELEAGERARLLYHARRIAADRKRGQQASSKRLHASRLRQAMPPWADRDAIAAIYAEAARLTRSTGVAHEVDHIEPLLGRGASGLHVHYNLRVVPRAVNRRKSNKRE